MAELTERDVERIIRDILTPLNWKVRVVGNSRGYMCYSPDGKTMIRLADQEDPNDVKNTFAKFRRAGVIMDKARLNGRKAGKSKHKSVIASGPKAVAPAQPASLPALPAVPSSDAARWTLTPHALKRMRQRGLARQDIIDAVVMPAFTAPAKSPGAIEYQRAGVTVVANPRDYRVLTVYPEANGLPVRVTTPVVTQEDLPPTAVAVDEPAMRALIERTQVGVKTTPTTRRRTSGTIDAALPATGNLPKNCTLVFEAPPKEQPRGVSAQQAAFVTETLIPALEAHPGEWVRAFEYEAAGSGYSRTKALAKDYPDYPWEFRVRRSGSGEKPPWSKVWVRFKPKK